MAEFDQVDTIELRHGHVLTRTLRIAEVPGAVPLPLGPPARLDVITAPRYACSCGELAGGDARDAQRHVEELRSPTGADR